MPSETEPDEITPEILARFLSVHVRITEGSTEGERRAARAAAERMLARYPGIGEAAHDAEQRARRREREAERERDADCRAGRKPSKKPRSSTWDDLLREGAQAAAGGEGKFNQWFETFGQRIFSWGLDQMVEALQESSPGISIDDLFNASLGGRMSRDEADEKPKRKRGIGKRRKEKAPQIEDLLDEAVDNEDLEITVDVEGDEIESLELHLTADRDLLLAITQDPEGFVTWIMERAKEAAEGEDDDE